MWAEMKTMFGEKGFQSVELNNPGMALFYGVDTGTQRLTAVWMISDAEMHRMNRMQYQAYLSTLLKKLRGRAPRTRIISLFMTSDIDYVNLIAGQMDPMMFGYYIVNPIG